MKETEEESIERTEKRKKGEGKGKENLATPGLKC